MESPVTSLTTAMLKSYRECADILRIDAQHQVGKTAVIDIVSALQRLIFGGFFDGGPLRHDAVEYHIGELMGYLLHNLQIQIRLALSYKKDQETVPGRSADDIAYAFLERLPEIQALVATDVEATHDGDPAANGKDEIVLSYPGVYVTMVNRLAHELHLLDVPLIPRMMTEHAHSLTGIDIHPGASIGHHFFIDHGTGVVVGETTVIGNFVKIYQGVTLGAMSVRGGRLLRGAKRHPTIRDHVTIYSGASILGGDTVIGEGVVIGSNAFITKSVPEQTRVSVKNPELRIREGKKAGNVEFAQNEFWDYVI